MGKLTRNQWDELITEYKAGGTTMALAKKYDISRSSVLRNLRFRGVKFHPPGFLCTKRSEENTNVHVFDELTPTSAYWLGLLFADGCVLDNNQVTLALKSTDGAHIDKFKAFMQSNNSVHNGSGLRRGKRWFTNALRVQNAHLARTLASYGMGPRKSLTAEAREDLVPNKHFWTGYVDGDGSVYSWTKKGEALPRIGFSAVGSEKMMHQLAEFAEPIIGKRMNVRKSENIFCLACEGAFAYKIIKYLYGDAEVALDRKMTKAKEIIDYYEKKLAQV
jgi:hypothetical protein